jgi:hypothetical protein
VAVGELLVLAGPTWQVPRYAFMLLPLLWLIAGGVLGIWLRSGRAGAAVALGLAAFVGVTGYSTAFAQEWGYDQAFRHVQQLWQPGDVVLTTNPPASALYLGRCDYYVVQFGWGEDLMEGPDGSPIDRWTGAPLLNTVGQLQELLATTPRVWLVVDGWRFQSWFESEFIRTVLDQMRLTFEERGMAVFLGQGYTERPAPALSRPIVASFGNELTLARVELSAASLQAGDDLEVSLAWRALEAPRPAYTVFLHLIGHDGVRVAQRDELLLGGFYQPSVWPRDKTVTDRHTLMLPADMRPGRYRLEIGLYRPDTLEAVPLAADGPDRMVLAYLSTPRQSEPNPQVLLGADFGGRVRLLGYTLACDPPSAPCTLWLYWQAVSRLDVNYTVFVHLVGQDGHIVSQHDGMPEGGFYPTAAWEVGETIEDEHPLDMTTDVPQGDYSLLVGLYHLETAERLLVTGVDGQPLGDSLTLTTIRVP